ncbi:MAG TPA: hypothetical protein VFZ68_11085 [Acidimicrobiales bacterium]
MGWNPIKAIKDAGGAVIDAGRDAVDSVVDAVEDAGEAVADAAQDAGSSVWGGVKEAGGGLWGGAKDALDAAADASGAAGGLLGDAIAGGATVVDTATGGLAGEALEGLDDYVFDTVDYATGGAVDIDFDDGKFSVGAGIPGVAGTGASIGEHGIDYHSELPGGELQLGLTDDGLLISGHGGVDVDWAPLPYVSGHLEISEDGDVLINGEAQGTLPIPGVGVLTGDASGAFVKTDQGWGAFVDGEGTLYLPSGTQISADVLVRHEQDQEGSHTTLGLEGSVTKPGVGTAGGGIGYERLEKDGDVVEAFHAEGHAKGYGMSVEAEADYVHIDAGGVEHSEWSGDVAIDGPGGDSGDDASATGASATGASGDDVLGETAAIGQQVAPAPGAGAHPGDAVDVSGPGGAQGAGDAPATGGVDPGADDVAPPVAAEPAPVEAPQPADEFDQAIQAADDVEASFDDLMDDVQ